jgi:tripartite-type tricarboxylate transporter receptor subunit TctC
MMIATGRKVCFKTIGEMVEQARAQPESVSYGTAGIGSSQHLAVEAMARAAGIKLLHVPYSGVGPALAAMLSGDIDLVAGAPLVIMPVVASLGIVPLAHTGPEKWRRCPMCRRCWNPG